MKYVLLFSVILFSISSTAQDCTKELLKQKPGTWKAGIKGSEGGTVAEVTKEKKVVGLLHSMVKTNYLPMSVEALFNGSYMTPFSSMPANSYSYNVRALNFYCDGGQLKTAHESSSYFSISANAFEAEIYDTAQGDRATAEGFNVMADMPVEKDGYWFFKETDVSLGFGIQGKSNMWLVTYDGKLPYSYVTKKEFLEKRKRSLTSSMEMEKGGFKDVLKNNEIAKKYKETEYKKEPDKLQRYMKMEYLSTKERYENELATIEKRYKAAFAKIETLLSLPASELSQPAIVRLDPSDPLSYQFTDDNDNFGKILIKPNPGYFNKKLLKSSPQFFWVYIRGNHKEPIAAKFMADIIKAVDFNALKNMLGK